MKTESIIVCEGFHDRAFWAQWLTECGFSFEKPPSGKAKGIHGEEIGPGTFVFFSPNRHHLRVIPAGGGSKVRPNARRLLADFATRPIHAMILNVDSDAMIGEPTPDRLNLPDLARSVPGSDGNPQQADNRWIVSGAGGLQTTIASVIWQCDDPADPELPDQQSLERLVCASIREAFPQRAKAVADWLSKRPDPPPADPKEFAWSHMAGWHAEHGCDDFYRDVWRNPQIRPNIEKRLNAIGATDVVNLLLQAPPSDGVA